MTKASHLNLCMYIRCFFYGVQSVRVCVAVFSPIRHKSHTLERTTYFQYLHWFPLYFFLKFYSLNICAIGIETIAIYILRCIER